MSVEARQEEWITKTDKIFCRREETYPSGHVEASYPQPPVNTSNVWSSYICPTSLMVQILLPPSDLRGNFSPIVHLQHLLFLWFPLYVILDSMANEKSRRYGDVWMDLTVTRICFRQIWKFSEKIPYVRFSWPLKRLNRKLKNLI